MAEPLTKEERKPETFAELFLCYKLAEHLKRACEHGRREADFGIKTARDVAALEWQKHDQESKRAELAMRATVAALEATLDGYRAKGGAFFEDGMSFEAKMRADAEAKVAELEAEVARLTPLAAAGEAVEGMGNDTALWRTCIDWRFLDAVDDMTWPDENSVILSAMLPEGETVGSSFHDTALAALRAAEALVSPPLSTTGVVTSESGDDAKEGDGNA